MREVHKSVLLPYDRESLFNVVNDVAKYPEFIRWCARAHIVSEDDQQLTASLLLQARGISETITTRNVLQRPGYIALELVEGPFKEFEGGWRFIDLSTDAQIGTKVILDMRFSFSSMLLSATFGTVFNRVANTMIDSFCERAHSLLK